MEEPRIEYMPLSQVRRWPRNPKLHDHDSLGASIGRFGFVQPLLQDERTGQLVAGHGRLETLGRLKDSGQPAPDRIRVDPATGEWFLPVIRGVAFRDEKEAEAFLLADNRQAELGGWDEQALAAMLRDLRAGDAIAGIGWNAQQIDTMLKEAEQLQSMEAPVGPSPEDQLPGFLAASIKQVTLYFEAADYDKLMERLKRTMDKMPAESHTELFVKLLDHYEATAG